MLSRHVETGVLPEPVPEEIERIVQPSLKRRHPFFGLDVPPSDVKKTKNHIEIVLVEKPSKKRKKLSK